MRSRIAALGVVLVLGAGLLSACRSNVGVAARVGGHEISESSVGDYVLESGPSSAAVAQAKAQGGTLSPRSTALSVLVQRQLYREVLSRDGGIPGAGTLTGERADALRVLAQSQVPDAEADAQLRSSLRLTGVEPRLVDVYFEALELKYSYITRNKINDQAELSAALRKANVAVRINPRYGTWDRTQFVLDTRGSAPPYLQLQPTPGATSQQTAPAAP